MSSRALNMMKSQKARIEGRVVRAKDQIKTWNIVKGDKVAVIAGKDKDTIGTVKSVNRRANTVIVEGKNLVYKHVPITAESPKGVVRVEMPIHYSNLMLLHPDTQTPTKVDRRQVEKTLEDGRVVKRWARFVHNTDIEIPKPERTYPDKTHGEKFSTPPEEVSKVTFEGLNVGVPPVPQDLVRELRNVYKKPLPRPASSS
ncbi:hypothetical protein VTP01DRAFT_10840 [Rhizomucor pusillus]|uniref:mitochondrial 54S ribosomal uL24m domain-containing protein n=1 Tax=Rhizomucor pusillus TaxID=4840 RepID=UPI003742EFFD